MKLRYFLYMLCCSLAIGFTSCLDDEEPIDYILPTDAQLFSFKLTNDSIAELASVSYTIDQLNGKVYNEDSLSFGLADKIGIYSKAVFNYTTAISGGGNVYLIAEDPDNPTLINDGDSIAILPFLNESVKYLRVYAMDGTSKEYSLNLRAHLIDPDSVVYEQLSVNGLPVADSNSKTVLLKDQFYWFGTVSSALKYASSADGASWSSPAGVTGVTDIIPQSIATYNDTLYAQTLTGELYRSADAANWTQVSLGAPLATAKIVAILGETKNIPSAPSKVSALLSLIVEEDNETFFVKTDTHATWVKGDETPADFPVRDFTSVSWNKVNNYTSNLTLTGGFSSNETPVNAIWRTQSDALTGWSKLPAPQLVKGGAFAIPASSNIFYYNEQLHLINGSSNDKVYTSVDGGLTWLEMAAKYAPPAGYSPRENASVCIKDRFIYIFGGTTGGSPTYLTDVWRAKLNKLSFEN